MLCRPGTYFTRSSTDNFFFKVVILDLEILLALSARDSWGLLSFLSSLSDVIDSAVSLLLEESFSVEGQGSELFVVSWLDVDPIFSKELNASLFASLNVVKNVGIVGECSSMKWKWCYANFCTFISNYLEEISQDLVWMNHWNSECAAPRHPPQMFVDLCSD